METIKRKYQYISILLIIISSIILALYVDKQHDDKERIRFESVSKQIGLAIKDRMDAYRQVLFGGTGLFNGSSNVSRDEWREYVDSLQIATYLPGIQAVGFAKALKPTELESNIASIRKEGFPTYTVHPKGKRDLYTSIIYIEPFDERNIRAFGYDMYSQSTRHSAMKSAMETGKPYLSGKVQLLQEDGIDLQAGFLLYVPLYKKGMALTTLEDRVKAIDGFVYAPFRVKDFMRVVAKNLMDIINIKIYDNKENEDSLLFSSTSRKNQSNATLQYKQKILIDGRQWIVKYYEEQSFKNDIDKYTPLIIIIGGLLLSFLSFFLIQSFRKIQIKQQEHINELSSIAIEKQLALNNLKKAENLSKLGNWSLDLINNKLVWSDEIFNIFEVDKEKFKASYDAFLNSIHPDDRNMVNEAYANSLQTQESYEIEHRLLMNDGKIKYVKEQCESTFDKDGKPLVSIGTVQDITEHVKDEKRLRFRDKQLLVQSRLAQMGEMISMIAHQWRQPISTIAMGANNILIDIELNNIDKNSLRDRANDIVAKTVELSKTIDDFRNFYKPNKQSIITKLEDVIEKSLNITKSSLIHNNINIIKEYNSDEEIELYDREVMQVILNILKNAQDNIKEKDIKDPYIKITTKDRIISICDNGGGISEDIIEKIFDPYFSTKNEKNGTGLGLYMSKTIIEEHHNGKISVQNRNDGVCFIIELGIISKK